MDALSLNCCNCGAPASSDSPACGHCGARLATISCPACLGMMFLGSKFCPHCGAGAVRWQSSASELPCPSCRVKMLEGDLGSIKLHECGKCFGVWLDPSTFEGICRDSEQQAVVLGAAHRVASPGAPLPSVRYLRCPSCDDLMNRVNFAKHSGVVVDVCREHGTWFDMNELQRIVEFLRAGGLDLAREREKRELAEERRRLQAARSQPVALDSRVGRQDDDLLVAVVRATGSLLGEWLKR